jgi:cysteine-rich repeat protein
VAAAQLSACDGKPDGESCRVQGMGLSACFDGVCLAQTCGDGRITGSELCDDGGTVSCDGCSADCRSDESCGNALVECSEQCDAGAANSDAPDALCRPSCELQRCGDGTVDEQSGEDCDGAPDPLASCHDFGFYGGALTCSEGCRNNTSTCAGSCGDGVVNGEEVCDALPPGGRSCLDFGYDVGNLGCSPFCTPSFARCERLGFEAMPLSVGAFLIWTWGSAADDIYAVGDAGASVHYDGASWSELELGVELRSNTSLNGIWGSAANDVFIVGDFGTVIHYDGQRWSLMDTGSDESLKTVWGTGSDDVFAAGSAGTILHYDGERWSAHDSGVSSVLWSISGTQNDLYVAGEERTLLHYDGERWNALSPPVAEDFAFYGVWARDGEVFAAGDAGTILRRDDSVDGWSAMESGVPDTYLYGFFGLSPSDLYLSGSGGVILHYDGEHWSSLNTGSTQDLFSVWGSDEDSIFAVGPGTALHLGQGGPQLSLVPSGSNEQLNSVFGHGVSELTVVGDNGTILRLDGDLATAMPSPTTENLRWIWGSAGDDLFAVGTSGTIVHHDGDDWTPMPSPTQETLNAVWGTSGDDVFAVGEVGTFLHYDGSAWSLLDAGTDAYLYNVWGSGPNDVFVGGSGGLILHYDGRQVTPMQSGTDAEIYGLWGTRSDDVYAFADIGGAFHYDGNAWSPLTFSSSQALDYAGGSSTTDIWSITTFATALFHYDGLDWAPVRLPLSTPALFGLWMADAGGYVVGAEGSILRVNRRCSAREKNCEDRWDNDCDGLLNCADPDCESSAFCAAGGLCETPLLLGCGSALTSSTAGEAPRLEVYGCSPRVERGRETYHRFTADEATDVTARLSAFDADLDLLVLASTEAGGCDARKGCLTADATTESSHQVEFRAEAGETYFVVVDGHLEESAGRYSLEVSCR